MEDLRQYSSKLDINYKYKMGLVTYNVFTNTDTSFDLLQNFNFISINWQTVSHYFILMCHILGLEVFLFTYNNKDQYKIFNKYLIDGIISDIKTIMNVYTN